MPNPMHPSMEEYYGLSAPGTHCQVLFCGREDNLPGNRVDVNRKECVFHLVTAGYGTVCYSSDYKLVFRLERAHGFFCLPGQRCIYRPDPIEPWSYRWIGFTATDLDDLLAGIGVDRENPLIRLGDGHPAEDRLLAILELLRDRPPQADLRASGLLISLLAELSGGSAGRQTAMEPRSFVDRAKNFVQAQYRREIDVDDVARHVGISGSYLLKLFRRETGGSVRDYLVYTRLERAQALLKFSSISVAEAALAVGFRNYASFERTFRRRYGCSPSAWRSGIFFGPPA
jgi:AraC-like DNA-binding protein